MNLSRIVAIFLIVLGVLGLVYGGFTFTKESQEAKLGPIEVTVKDKKTVNIPIWIAVGSIISGSVLLLFLSRKVSPTK